MRSPRCCPRSACTACPQNGQFIENCRKQCAHANRRATTMPRWRQPSRRPQLEPLGQRVAIVAATPRKITRTKSAEIGTAIGGRASPARRDPCAASSCSAPRTVAGRVALDAPSLLERTRIHRVEAELVEQARDRRLGGAIVAGDHQRAAILRARRRAVGRELRRRRCD